VSGQQLDPTILPLPPNGDGRPLVITIHLKTSLDEPGQLLTHRSMELTFTVQVPGRMATGDFIQQKWSDKISAHGKYTNLRYIQLTSEVHAKLITIMLHLLTITLRV